MIANGGEWAGRRYLQPESIRLMTTNQLPAEAFPIRFGTQVRHGTGFSLSGKLLKADFGDLQGLLAQIYGFPCSHPFPILCGGTQIQILTGLLNMKSGFLICQF